MVDRCNQVKRWSDFFNVNYVHLRNKSVLAAMVNFFGGLWTRNNPLVFLLFQTSIVLIFKVCQQKEVLNFGFGSGKL